MENLDNIYSATDDLPDEQLIKAFHNFLTEQGLEAKFLVWIEKWKNIHRQGGNK